MLQEKNQNCWKLQFNIYFYYILSLQSINLEQLDFIPGQKRFHLICLFILTAAPALVPALASVLIDVSGLIIVFVTLPGQALDEEQETYHWQQYWCRSV